MALALCPLGSSALFYQAEAVSDFYIPVSEMPKHEIHSPGGPLQIAMKIAPKIFSPLFKAWVPKAFKLETDADIIISWARNALDIKDTDGGQYPCVNKVLCNYCN